MEVRKPQSFHSSGPQLGRMRPAPGGGSGTHVRDNKLTRRADSSECAHPIWTRGHTHYQDEGGAVSYAANLKNYALGKNCRGHSELCENWLSRIYKDRSAGPVPCIDNRRITQTPLTRARSPRHTDKSNRKDRRMRST